MLIEAVEQNLLAKDPTAKMGKLVNDRRDIKIITREEFKKLKHNIPLPDSMIEVLRELKYMNGDGFVFSLDGGASPICRRTMYDNFHRALNAIGISDDEISERHLHLHGWRHFCNTEMLKGGLTIPQAQAITGHKSNRMTEWYCHFDPVEYEKAKAVQEHLLMPPDTDGTTAHHDRKEEAKPEPVAYTNIIPMPVCQETTVA